MPYVIYRRDGYLIITRRSSPKILNKILNAYRKMHWFTRERWLRQYGNVHAVPSIIRPYLDDFVGIHPMENAVSIANSVVLRALRQVSIRNRILINTLRKFPFRLGQWLAEPIRPEPLERAPALLVDYLELDPEDVEGVLKRARWVVEVEDYGIARFKRTTWLYRFFDEDDDDEDEVVKLLVVKDRASLEDILNTIIDNEETGDVVLGIAERIQEFRRECPEDCHILNMLNPLALPGG